MTAETTRPVTRPAEVERPAQPDTASVPPLTETRKNGSYAPSRNKLGPKNTCQRTWIRPSGNRSIENSNSSLQSAHVRGSSFTERLRFSAISAIHRA